MNTQKNSKKQTNATIVVNRKARHDYFIEDHYEAGIALDGWEVKSLRAGRVQIIDSYIIHKQGELWLLGAIISPLPTVSTHITPDAQKTRKLLMHRHEINRLKGLIDRQGYALVPLSLYWCKGRVKVDVGLSKGKKQFDKRASLKERDWERQKQRIMKQSR